MSTATLARPVTEPALHGDPSAQRFLRSYAATMLALIAGLVAIEAGWRALADTAWVASHAWPVAGAAAIGWVVAVSGVLRARGWRPGPISAVVGAPAAVLVMPAAAGWLSPQGVVLWGPLTTVLAVALAVVAGPDRAMGSGRRRQRGGR